MGCLFVIILGVVSAVITYLFGYGLYVMVILGILWLFALVISAVSGHRFFGGGGNMDLMIVITGMVLAAAIIVPRYNALKPCDQAKEALRKLASAEDDYFSGHKAFTTDLNSLDLMQDPEVTITIIKGDEESFVAAASHSSCNKGNKGYKGNNGAIEVFMWDSAKGGLQGIRNGLQ